jgi:hypothetical protein
MVAKAATGRLVTSDGKRSVRYLGQEDGEVFGARTWKEDEPSRQVVLICKWMSSDDAAGN